MMSDVLMRVLRRSVCAESSSYEYLSSATMLVLSSKAPAKSMSMQQILPNL